MGFRRFPRVLGVNAGTPIRSRFVLGAILPLFLVAVGVCARGNDSGAAAGTNLSSPQAPISSNASAVSGIADSDKSSMLSGGDQLQVLLVAPPQVRVDASQAVASAIRSLGFLDGARVVSTTIGRLTDSKLGAESDGSTDPTSHTLLVQNRLVWIVVFADVNPPARGPLTSSAPAPGGAKDRMWVAIDALTSQMLIARSVFQVP